MHFGVLILHFNCWKQCSIQTHIMTKLFKVGIATFNRPHFSPIVKTLILILNNTCFMCFFLKFFCDSLVYIRILIYKVYIVQIIYSVLFAYHQKEISLLKNKIENIFFGLIRKFGLQMWFQYRVFYSNWSLIVVQVWHFWGLFFGIHVNFWFDPSGLTFYMFISNRESILRHFNPHPYDKIYH